MVFFGTTAYAAVESMDILAADGIEIDSMRIKSFPFHTEVVEFIKDHEQIIVVEQNRDAQFRSLLINELDLNPKDVKSVLNYGGMPITARTIEQQIIQKLEVTV